MPSWYANSSTALECKARRLGMWCAHIAWRQPVDAYVGRSTMIVGDPIHAHRGFVIFTGREVSRSRLLMLCVVASRNHLAVGICPQLDSMPAVRR